MRCKKHLSDHSSSIGVCASCLRDRLFSLIHSRSQPHPDPNSKPDPITEPNPKQPSPLIFPRSVSPYITRRKSDPVHRFHPTPQHNPNPNPNPNSAPKAHKFSLLTKLFRSRSSKPDPDPTPSTSTSTSSSYVHHRGLSPDFSDPDPEPEPSPARGVHRRVKPSPARSNVAGFAFCLSPLVRASPARNWADAGYYGEIRVPGNHTNNNNVKNNDKPHLSAAASFCANRSKKLADIGRFNRNR